MNERAADLHRAITGYYVQGETMESIARTLGVSRSTVSRLLADARERGLVRITISEEVGSASPLARDLRDAFGVGVHLVPGPSATPLSTRMTHVAQRAALLFAEAAGHGQNIGVAWGVTVAGVARHLPRTPLVDSRVVQLNGSANPRSSGVPYIGEILHAVGQAFDSPVVLFPVPAFFDHLDSKRCMWRERSVAYVLDLQRSVDLAVFGVGSLTGSIPSHVYAAGYLDADEREHLRRAGVVGDVCTVLLREDGSWADLPENERASGLTPSELAAVPRRLCVAADPLRAPAILGALRAGVATDLVLDEQTARAVLARL